MRRAADAAPHSPATAVRAQYDQEEIQEVLGRSFAVDADVDEDELLGELDLIENELALEPLEEGTALGAGAGAPAVPSFLEEPSLPAVPTGNAPEPARPLNA